jgi:hypothetical protein
VVNRERAHIVSTRLLIAVSLLSVGLAALRGSISRGGHYQEDVVGVAKPLPANSRCQTCHAKSGAVDDTFVQFYPTLIPVAKAKHTFKSTDDK